MVSVQQMEMSSQTFEFWLPHLEHGRDPAFEMCPGLLETRFYAAHGVPAFAYGPGLLTVSHGPNEFVPIRNIAQCAAVYALTAAEMLR
jgi:succinyl-diaminopimelate desuccinylase